MVTRCRLVPASVSATLTRRGVRTTPNSLNRHNGRAFRCALGCGNHLRDRRRFRGVIVHTATSNRMLHLGSMTGIRLKHLACKFTGGAGNRPDMATVVFRATNSGTARVVGSYRALLGGTRGAVPPNMGMDVSRGTGSFLFTSVRRMVGALVRTFVLIFVMICVFLRSLHSALVPTVTVPMTLVNAFFMLCVVNFDVGLLALYTVILTVTVIISSTVIIIRNIRTGLSRNCGSTHLTSVSTVDRLNNTVISVALMVVSIFVPIDFVSKASNMFCHRFNLAVTVTVKLSTMGTLALAPTLYTVLLGPRSPRREGGSAFIDHFRATFGICCSKVLGGCGGNALGFVRGP